MVCYTYYRLRRWYIIITVIDVIRAISTYMTEHYPQFPIDDRDIADTVDRPCAFIDVDNMDSEIYAVGYVRDSADIDIYLFVEHLETGFLELLHAKNDLLTWLSKSIKLDNELGYVTPNEVSATISKADKALRVSFSMELIQELPNDEDDLPYLEDLETKENVNG